MKKNVKINDVVYSNIDTIKLQSSESSGFVSFVETSDSNATASDVVSGKTCYVNGTKIVGTKIDSGGSSTINLQEKTITSNGTYTADSGYVGLSKVIVNVPSGSGGGEVANFPFPHTNIQTGSFSPTENILTQSITLNFTPKAFLCIIDNPNQDAGVYAGVSWFYMANDNGNNGAEVFYRSNSGKMLVGGSLDVVVVSDNVVTLSSEVIKNYYFYAGRTYYWVAWDF